MSELPEEAVEAGLSERELREALTEIVEFCDDPHGSEKPETLAMGLARLLPAARAALAKAPAPERTVGVKVKPLEWMPFRNGHQASSIIGSYQVDHDGDEPGEWSLRRDGQFYTGCGFYATEAEAKAAAQADNDTRILSALAERTVAPAEPVAVTRLPELRCDGCDNGVDPNWTYCPWCGAQSRSDLATPEVVNAIDEIGWVIERGDSDPSAPTYWAGLDDRWSQDHLDAIRFARKRDAERISARMRWPNNRVCEHIWSSALATPISSALAPTVPATGQDRPTVAPEEPVAWQRRYKGGDGWELISKGFADQLAADPNSEFEVRALYASPPALPDGWRAVPVEPTEAMIGAAMGKDSGGSYHLLAKAVWSAMIAAAPLASAPMQEDAGR